MMIFEYKTERVHANNLEPMINGRAEQGWRLHTAAPSPSCIEYTLVFERPKKADEEVSDKNH